MIKTMIVKMIETMCSLKRVRNTLFVTLYTLSIYLSVHKQLIRSIPNHFRGTHCKTLYPPFHVLLNIFSPCLMDENIFIIINIPFLRIPSYETFSSLSHYCTSSHPSHTFEDFFPSFLPFLLFLCIL